MALQGITVGVFSAVFPVSIQTWLTSLVSKEVFVFQPEVNNVPQILQGLSARVINHWLNKEKDSQENSSVDIAHNNYVGAIETLKK